MALPALHLVARPYAHAAQRVGRVGWYYGWAIVAVACLTAAAGYGTRAAYGVLLVPLADAFGWGRGLAAGALALNALVSALCSAPLGILLDRWGPRWVFGGMALVAGAGLALCAASGSALAFYLAMGGLAGIGLAPLRPQTLGVVVANWFVGRRGLATGIVSAGIGLGVFVLVPLTQWMLAQAGWQAAFLALGAVFVFGVAPLNTLVQRHHPEDCGLVPLGGRTGASAPLAGPTAGQALHSWRFWLLTIGIGIGSLPHSLLMAHTVAYLTDQGVTHDWAVAVLSLSGAGAVAAMLLWGYVADRWSGEWAYTAGTVALVACCGSLHFVAPGRELLLVAYTALLALGFASRQGLTAFMVAALVQRRALGALMGIVSASVALNAALGPALGGWIFDATGSYALALDLVALCAVGSSACVSAAAPRKGPILDRPRTGASAVSAGPLPGLAAAGDRAR